MVISVNLNILHYSPAVSPPPLKKNYECNNLYFHTVVLPPSLLTSKNGTACPDWNAFAVKCTLACMLTSEFAYYVKVHTECESCFKKAHV